MHETVNVDNPARCTRNWFEWANAMLVVFVENSLGESCDVHGDIEFDKSVRLFSHSCFPSGVASRGLLTWLYRFVVAGRASSVTDDAWQFLFDADCAERGNIAEAATEC
jgi:hypothetical protein